MVKCIIFKNMMNKSIKSGVLLTVFTVFCMSAFAQTPTMKVMKDGVAVFQSEVSNVDSIVFSIDSDITAAELVANIKVGWNLGNTLDCSDLTWLGNNPSVSAMETAWGNPVTTKAMITAIKNAGFNAIRIPVSWNKVVDANYNIRADWMARVTEIVNYAIDNDMYVLLNTHHDEGIFKFTDAQKAASLNTFGKIWAQIADNFKNYNKKLVFEALNEPRTIGSAAEWSGGTAEERSVLNEHYQLFVNTVRASGGNNDKRILLINSYGASGTQTAINGLNIPTDTGPNKIIVSFHNYAPYDFALNANSTVSTWSQSNSADTSPITGPINLAYNKFVSQNIPVIIGEFGALDRKNESVRAEWAKYYVSTAKNKGMKCFWWDDGGNFKLLSRSNNNNTIFFPQIADALISGAN